MGFFSNFSFDNFLSAETKSTNVITTPLDLPNRSVSDIRRDVAADAGQGGYSHLQVSALFACARAIAEGLATLPCLLQRKTATGGIEAATDHPLYDVLARSPNDYMTSYEFREWVGFQLAITGNAFLWITRDPDGRVIELLPLPNGSVTVERNSNRLGEVAYRFSGNRYTKAKIWHLKSFSWDSITGNDPRMIAARSLGLAADIENYGIQYYRNGATPSGLLTTDKDLTQEQYQALMDGWHKQQTGIANAHKTAVLHGGLTFQSTQTNASDALLIDARRFQIEDICRMMRVDPVMVQQSMNTATYNSLEQRQLAHLVHTLKPWIERFSQSAETVLLSKKEQADGYRVYFDTRELTLTTAAERAAYYATMRQNGLMTQNECREHAGLDRSDDPDADKLIPAANLFGPNPSAAQSTTSQD